MVEPGQIHEGMGVRSRDGRPLGRIQDVDTDGLVIEPGVLFAREHRVRLAAVEQVQAGEVWLRESLHQLQHAEDAAVVAGALPGPGAQHATLHVRELHAGAPHTEGPREGRPADARMDGLSDGLAPGPAALDDSFSRH
jgi:hypothetical protein